MAGKIPAGFTEHYADVNGVKLHYFIGGKDSAVVLLHGYAETSHMWLLIMPELAKNHTVIVPDLRGAGDSSKPESGYDKKNMAVEETLPAAGSRDLGFDWKDWIIAHALLDEARSLIEGTNSTNLDWRARFHE